MLYKINNQSPSLILVSIFPWLLVTGTSSNSVGKTKYIISPATKAHATKYNSALKFLFLRWVSKSIALYLNRAEVFTKSCDRFSISLRLSVFYNTLSILDFINPVTKDIFVYALFIAVFGMTPGLLRNFGIFSEGFLYLKAKS